MTPEERQLLSGLFDRLRAANPGEIDREAMEFINNALRANPNAAYVMAQSVLVQEEMINTASAKVKELEGEVAQLKQGAGAAAAPRSALGGTGAAGLPPRRTGGGFGAGATPAMAAMAPRGPVPPSGIQVPAPGSMGAAPGAPQGGPWQRPQADQQAGGGSFLKTALGAAVGVAGGMLLANSLSSMFGGGKAQAAEGAQSPAGSNDGWGDTGAGGWNPDSAGNAGNQSWGDDGGGSWNSDDSGSWDDSGGGDSWGGDE